MQGKLIIKNADTNKLQSAAHFAGVKLGDALPVGDELHVESSAKEAQAYFKLGVLIGQVTGKELEQLAAAKAKKEAEAKAREAKKK